MIWLILGLLIWIGAHLLQRVAPGARAALTDRLGAGSKGVIAVILVVGIVLMVIGYRSAEFIPVYLPPAWGVHLNNLLMLIAVALMGLGHSKSRLKGALRHPMLIGVTVWAVAHLLVNGDLASLVLFGAMGLWALLEIRVINRAAPNWTRPEGGTVAGDLRLGVITLVVFAVIVLIHGFIGPSPFPGG